MEKTPDQSRSELNFCAKSFAAAGLYLVFFALWLWHHRYKGIWHDAELYALQALRLLHPANYAHDVFFTAGSQDDFTLFSPLFAHFIGWFGLGEAAILLTLAGGLLWVLGAFRFSSFLQGHSRWLFLALIVLFPIAYGGRNVFHAGEPFVTPRIFAEGLVLLSLAELFARRWLNAGALILVAGVLHPLMTLAGVTFGYFYLFRWQRRWLFVTASVLLAGLLLAYFKVSLLGRLSETMGAHWFDLVYQRTSYYMFPTAWGISDYNMLIWNYAVLGLAWYASRNMMLRQIFLAAGLTGGVGLLFAIVGGDWLHSVLLLQLQIWRVLWLVFLIAYAAFAWLAVESWGNKERRFVLFGLVAAYFMREQTGGFIACMTVLAAVYNAHLTARLRLLLLGIFTLAIGFGVFWAGVDAMSVYSIFKPGVMSETEVWLRRLEAFNELIPLVSAAVVWVSLLLYRRSGSGMAYGIAFGLVTVVILGWSLSQWDVRGNIKREFESAKNWGHAPFDAYIPVEATVYWQDAVNGTWFSLGRSSYFSIKQAAGIVFSRQTAETVYQHYLHVSKLGGGDSVFHLMSRNEAFWRQFRKDYVEPGSYQGLLSACRVGGPDYVILGKRYASVLLAETQDPFFGSAYLYRCSTVRKTVGLPTH